MYLLQRGITAVLRVHTAAAASILAVSRVHTAAAASILAVSRVHTAAAASILVVSRVHTAAAASILAVSRVHTAAAARYYCSTMPLSVLSPLSVLIQFIHKTVPGREHQCCFAYEFS